MVFLKNIFPHFLTQHIEDTKEQSAKVSADAIDERGGQGTPCDGKKPGLSSGRRRRQFKVGVVQLMNAEESQR
jgi:hypothetical protein